MVLQDGGNDALQLEALLAARAYLYTLFHKLFGGEPTADALDVLFGEATADAVEEFAQGCETLAGFDSFLRKLAQQNREELLDSAKDEYTRVFIGPMTLPASPYESPYRSNEATLFQENTLVVRDAYRAEGYLPKAYQHVPDDHVALLCHFCALRAASALDAFREGNTEQAAGCLRSQNTFAREHMANWLGEYARQLRYNKTAVLYPQLVEALAAFVTADCTFADEAAFWLEDDDATAGSSGEFEAFDKALDALVGLPLPYLSDNELDLA